MPAEDTIVAISTPPGRGGIGIVRLSGAAARTIVEPLLRLRHPLVHAHARFAEVLDATGETLDEAVVTWFEAPRSYTSEDVVEIAAHGSPVLLDHLIRKCIAGGARLAEPGEFTQRAFLSGRLDLTQAEAIHDLIEANTLQQARLAARQLGGSLSRQIAPVKAGLIALIAAMEAGIDFAEDDLDLLSSSQITEQIQAVQAPLQALEQTFAYGRILREGFTLAIVGRPNAGKSSLFNRLVQRDRAIVTASPGTTRDAVAERISLDGVPVELIDTAGLRAATDEAESLGIAKSRETMAEADLVLLVLDATAPLHAEDKTAMAALAGRPLLIVRNKIDLHLDAAADVDAAHATLATEAPIRPPTEIDAETTQIGTGGAGIETGSAEEADDAGIGTEIGTGIATQAIPNIRPDLETSALTGAGIPELRQAILSRMTQHTPTSETALLTSLRQQQAVSSALQALARAQTANAAHTPHEMILLDLYEALHALDTLTGTTATDDILNLIFSTFCIGK